MQDYGTVGKRDWGDRPVYIVGGGPSLKPYIDKLQTLFRKGIVLAVNNSHHYCYFPDAIFTLDHLWLSKHIKPGKDSENLLIKDFSGPVFAAVDEGNPREESKNLTYLRRSYRAGITDRSFLSEDSTLITNGMNSGYGALNFAYLKGAKRIYLLGFDFKKSPEADTHFHSGYKWYNKASESLFPYWAAAFNDTVAQLKNAGVEVFNCNPDSLVTCFPFKSYEEVLE